MIARIRIYAGRHVRGHVWKLFGVLPVWQRRFW